jgi:catechol 2,3-dioxygenase-like lactoylglutathione lyase family enzyme
MNGEPDRSALRLVQLALNTCDLSASLRLYAELFGFANAGGSAAWGPVLAMQDLPDDAHCLVWWMVGATPLFQLELFHHGSPDQRPQPSDWRPSDHGWVRFGVAVSDLDRVVAGLERFRIGTLGRAGTRPTRRLAFRDPHVGGIVEVIERRGEPAPAIVYVTSSVADIGAAERFYRQVLGAPIRPLGDLHSLDDEDLWGLPGARRDGFLVELPGGLLEIVEYASPEGRPHPPDHRTSDQGIMNVALGSRRQETIRALIDRVHGHGIRTPVVVDNTMLTGTYIIEPGYELELMNVPEELEKMLGFVPTDPFVTALGD